jgi:hypothetical protein
MKTCCLDKYGYDRSRQGGRRFCLQDGMSLLANFEPEIVGYVVRLIIWRESVNRGAQQVGSNFPDFTGRISLRTNDQQDILRVIIEQLIANFKSLGGGNAGVSFVDKNRAVIF